MVQDQRTLREENFMGFSRATPGLRHEERECVNKFAAAAHHMHMSNHIYLHLSRSQYLSDVKSKSMVDAVDRHTSVPARCFYRINPTIGPRTSNYLAFAAAARPSDCRSGDGTGRQQFNNSQEPRLNINYQYTSHGGVLENGSVVQRLPSDSLAMESSKDQQFLNDPYFQEPGSLRMMTGPQVVARGPSLCGSRPLLASEARTIKGSIGGQLTMFYKGQVNVYNNVVPAKVQDIMLMAATLDSSPQPLELSMKTSDSHVLVECEKLPLIDLNTRSEPADESEVNRAVANLTPIRVRMMQEDEADSSVAGPNNNFVEEEHLVPQALPQARKASLSRFLERRKERLMEKSPYSVGKNFQLNVAEDTIANVEQRDTCANRKVQKLKI